MAVIIDEFRLLRDPGRPTPPTPGGAEAASKPAPGTAPSLGVRDVLAAVRHDRARRERVRAC
jgi:hypothetical protein